MLRAGDWVIRVRRRLSSSDVIHVLTDLFILRGRGLVRCHVLMGDGGDVTRLDRVPASFLHEAVVRHAGCALIGAISY